LWEARQDSIQTDDPRVALEHMWVRVQAADVKNDVLIGVLANDPVFCDNVKDGDTVILKKEQIEAID